MYTYIYIYTHTHTYIHTYIHISLSLYIYIYTYVGRALLGGDFADALHDDGSGVVLVRHKVHGAAGDLPRTGYPALGPRLRPISLLRFWISEGLTQA